eukprot:SAG11_NODE_2675_length_3106_cov_2.195211_2_plen_157_part_00
MRFYACASWITSHFGLLFLQSGCFLRVLFGIDYIGKSLLVSEYYSDPSLHELVNTYIQRGKKMHEVCCSRSVRARAGGTPPAHGDAPLHVEPFCSGCRRGCTGRGDELHDRVAQASRSPGEQTAPPSASSSRNPQHVAVTDSDCIGSTTPGSCTAI